MEPTIAGFITFIQQVMGITSNYLPTTAPVITAAFNVAMSIVDPLLCQIDPSIYQLAVYNLAGDNLIRFAPDQTATITDITWTTGTATATTSAANGFATGDIILLSANAPLAYNSQPGPAQSLLGTPIVVTSPTTFTYAIANNPGAFTQGGMASEIYFQALRKSWNISGFVPGVISASSDESTSESLVVPEAFKNLMLSDLQNLKTPYGRQYLEFAQMTGTLWGVS